MVPTRPSIGCTWRLASYAVDRTVSCTFRTVSVRQATFGTQVYGSGIYYPRKYRRILRRLKHSHSIFMPCGPFSCVFDCSGSVSSGAVDLWDVKM